ncbi:hypothetical protein DH2020_045832 [Rehmannia glutinosa]|uniref:VQ domain-containing protein n=1 Tax=Rehmannia glutinosa TaxID=99300 RepID=A0ABR0UD27_REHGL
MASSDNLMTMEQPWFFRPTFADAWASDIFTKETDTLTKALQMSFASTSSDGDAFSAEMVESLFAKPDMAPIQTPTASGCSENEPPAVSKPRRSSVPPSGRVTKRKSRASKRATTTFITADPSNFRQMVQQVTGVRFSGLNGQLPTAPVLKPEPHRVIDRLQIGRGLPTFDTSAYLLDGSASSLMAQPQTPYTVAADGGSSGNGLDFDSFCSFPTLESWKVM